MYTNKKSYLYTSGKHDVKFMRSVYTKAAHFQKPMFSSVSTNSKSTNDDIWHVGHFSFTYAI